MTQNIFILLLLTTLLNSLLFFLFNIVYEVIKCLFELLLELFLSDCGSIFIDWFFCLFFLLLFWNCFLFFYLLLNFLFRFVFLSLTELHLYHFGEEIILHLLIDFFITIVIKSLLDFLKIDIFVDLGWCEISIKCIDWSWRYILIRVNYDNFLVFSKQIFFIFFFFAER